MTLRGPPTDELSLLARELTNQMGATSLRHAYTAASAQAFANIVTRDTIQEAVEQLVIQQGDQWRTATSISDVLVRAAARVPSAEDVVDTLERTPPALRVENALGVDRNDLLSAVEDYTRRVPNSASRVNAELPEAIAEFADYFPVNVDGTSGTTRQQLEVSLEGGSRAASRGASIAARAAARDSARAFARARSFGRLRGFSRIGGVLIGRPPTDTNQRLDVRSLDWTSVGEHDLALRVTDERGMVFEMGTFVKPLIHQALAYAADGRPVAVTMTTAAPLKELRILLHPALVDTPLGCRVIALDRFVDEFTSSDVTRVEMVEYVRAQGALYKVAWARRLVGAYERQLVNEEELPLEDMAAILSPSVRTTALVALGDLERLGDPSRSILAGKTDRFDPELVRVIEECSPGQVSLEGFEVCVGDSVRGMRPSERWVEPPPEFTVWSGVREVEYNLDPEFRFLQAAPGTLEPLEFMLQVAFVESEEDDEEPWEFPALADAIREAVAMGVQGSERHRDVLETARDFALLQRLFRAALDGVLGDEFPLQRMVELARETAAVPRAETARWNTRSGGLEFSLAVELISVVRNVEAGDGWQVDMIENMRRCIVLIEDLGAVTEVDGADLAGGVRVRGISGECCEGVRGGG